MNKNSSNIIDITNTDLTKFKEKNFNDFLDKFFSQNPREDFKIYSQSDLFTSAKASYDFFKSKKDSNFKISIIDGSEISESQESILNKHTIINITNIDIPFLVDSMIQNLYARDIDIINIIHPIFFVKRDENYNLTEIKTDVNEIDYQKESLIQIHVNKIIDQDQITKLNEDLCRVLEMTNLVVKDWKDMLSSFNSIKTNLTSGNFVSEKKASEIVEFIDWCKDGNFIFLGFKEFLIKKDNNNYSLEGVDSSALGVFTSKYEEFIPQVKNTSNDRIIESINEPYIIEILKSRYRSRIHRYTNAERIRIQKFSEDGKILGEYRILGMFTSKAYNQMPGSIPLIRGKIQAIIEQSGYLKDSHNYKDLITTLNSYPKDELFQASNDDLLRISMGVVGICGKSEVKFFPRKDKFNRFISCFIYIPRDASNSELRDKIKKYLSEVYNGEIDDAFLQITESKFIRQHLIIRNKEEITDLRIEEIEKHLNEISKLWFDQFKQIVRSNVNYKSSINLLNKYKKVFSSSYKDRFSPNEAFDDIKITEEILLANETKFRIYQNPNLSQDICQLKIYNRDRQIELSEIMPILESFGFKVIKEHTYKLEFDINSSVWIHYFHINLGDEKYKFSDQIKYNFEEIISLIWNKNTEVGSLNKLLISSNLNWRQILILRAYSKYNYQAGFRYSQVFVADTLVKNNSVTTLLIKMFETKFDTSLSLSIDKRIALIDEINKDLTDELEKISDVSEDAVIRKFINIINATIRTNCYQFVDGKIKNYISFKFDCSKIPGLPLPVPYAEIFVYSKNSEAVHLRGGKVARGGLRWSDRHEDFRTEILGLVKAQTTKNAVIVPVGSKGGFVVKIPTQNLNRDQVLANGIECYKTFLRGLLDITDNIIDNKIIKPKDCLIYDGDDPYLVVAADKGTATFSDIANSISQEYNFWLGDAFASGGSYGYDHKKMGITAKGGWVSVKRHFFELGKDIQNEEFTCAGIGDLSGDVFGNGMLLSKCTKLVAAFNHVHIFIDPNPDKAKSFEERLRMFNLPRSSWLDYNKSLISKGGDIFERSSKTIKLSEEIKTLLDIDKDEINPNDLIKAILKAKVDLLWNGGIGTYVKSEVESHADAGDRANDAVRINGKELRCKVVGEGGNLGFTQKGRIEYAQNGGAINTDAMDNSAGVDCSDHEVNIKIALTQALKDKKINFEERNILLADMTDQVEHLVLEDNRMQTQAISTESSQSYQNISNHSDFLDNIEEIGLLNRSMEYLPSKNEINKRIVEKKGLTRPELCVMLSYAKMDLYDKLLKSNLINDDFFNKDLAEYFPQKMKEKFSHEVLNHQLKREIIATQITNYIVNYAGITFVNSINQDTGYSYEQIVKSFIIATESLRIKDIFKLIEGFDGKISFSVQSQMFRSLNKVFERSTYWVLKNINFNDSVSELINKYQYISDQLFINLNSTIANNKSEEFNDALSRYLPYGVDIESAKRIASLDVIDSFFDIAQISLNTDLKLDKITEMYSNVGARFSLNILENRINNVPIDGKLQKISAKTLLNEIFEYHKLITQKIIEFSAGSNQISDINSIVQSWIKKNEFSVERYDDFIQNFNTNPSNDISLFVVATNRLKSLLT